MAGAPAITAGALDLPVERFITEIGSAVGRLARSVAMVRADALAGDVAMEAFNLAAAFVDADGTHTDDELWALISAFAGRLGGDLGGATPDELRSSGVVTGKRTWLDTPSPLFGLLVDSDRRNGTTNAWHYYDLAMHIGHTTCSIDLVASHAELVALERYRTSLLSAMEAAGLRRGGTAPGGPSMPSVAEVAAPLPPPRAIDELLSELDRLVGLAEVKAEVHLVTNLIRVRQLRRQRHLAVAETSRHLVFTGNPGTGKTTVARLVGQIYRTLGVVEKGQLVETDRAGLVAGYMGQTALKTTEVFKSATGGMLLIDEAYALARGQGGDFGEEAIDTLGKLMEDHRDDVVVIAAGYPDEMAEFLDANPGLRSRFPRTIHFPDYTTDELVAIFESICDDNAYQLTPEALTVIRTRIDAEPRHKGFGNGRLARNLFEAAVGRQASRIVARADPTDAELCSLLPEDVAAGG